MLRNQNLVDDIRARVDCSKRLGVGLFGVFFGSVHEVENGVLLVEILITRHIIKLVEHLLELLILLWIRYVLFIFV